MSMVEAPTRRMTAEEFYELPDEVASRFAELVRGEVVEMPSPGSSHGSVDSEIGFRLQVFVREHGLGRTFSNAGFILRRSPDVVRAPDQAFVAKHRLPPQIPARGYLEIAPDLAIEVLSPEDRPAAVSLRIRDYLEAGVVSVWLFDPLKREVGVYSALDGVRVLGPQDELEDSSVLAGFHLNLAEFWVACGLEEN